MEITLKATIAFNQYPGNEYCHTVFIEGTPNFAVNDLFLDIHGIQKPWSPNVGDWVVTESGEVLRVAAFGLNNDAKLLNADDKFIRWRPISALRPFDPKNISS